MSVKTFKKRCCYCKTWQTRNDSSNVAAILKPETNLQDSEQHFYYHNTCYCREKRIRPRLFQQPRDCILVDPNLSDTENYLKGHSYATDSTFLPFKENSLKKRDREASAFKLYDIPSHKKGGLGFSEIEDEKYRQKYGRYFIDNPKIRNGDVSDSNGMQTKETEAANYEELSHAAYNDVSKKRESEKKKDHLESEFDDNDGTPISNADGEDALNFSPYEDTDYSKSRNEIRKSNAADANEENTLNTPFADTDYPKPEEQMKKNSKTSLKEISDFRKDHYFETHSTEDLIKTIPEHICVHRFGLDSRDLPQPLHADGYGVSRCIICDKPMESPPLNKVDQRYNKKVNIFPKYYKYGLAPKKIYMANDDSVTIEMKLNGDKMNQRMLKVQKAPKYVDTYALRYQKGVI